jgi:hypothetical protein
MMEAWPIEPRLRLSLFALKSLLVKFQRMRNIIESLFIIHVLHLLLLFHKTYSSYMRIRFSDLGSVSDTKFRIRLWF